MDQQTQTWDRLVVDSVITLVDLLDKAGTDQAQFLRDSLSGCSSSWKRRLRARLAPVRMSGRRDTTQRNDRRERAWRTRLGAMQPAIPKLRPTVQAFGHPVCAVNSAEFSGAHPGMEQDQEAVGPQAFHDAESFLSIRGHPLGVR